MLRRLAGLASLALLTAHAMAAQQSYAQRTQTIHAGIVLVDTMRVSAGGPLANYNPFVWQNMNSNKRIKPAGWSFANPSAPSRVTDEIFQRWSAIKAQIGPADPNFNVAPIGSAITKQDAPYWEVRLSTATDTQMGNYDVLLLSAYNTVSLNSAEREKLRRFVDQGGILWVDTNDVTVMDPINNVPSPFVQLNGGVSRLTYADIFHPLLSKPNKVSLANLEALATEGNRMNISAVLQSSLTNVDMLAQTQEGDSMGLQPIAGNTNGPVISMSRIGDGFLVVTSRGYARSLNEVRLQAGNYDLNQRYNAMAPTVDSAADNAAKLTVNMINLTSSFTQPGQGTRKQNSTLADQSAPLMQSYGAVTAGALNTSSAAVLYKGLLVVTTANKIVVYDANPKSDLDRDGNPDDGFQDYSLGSTTDEIWESDILPGPISAPVCTEMPNASGVPTDQILVTDHNGDLQIFNAFPATGGILSNRQDIQAPNFGGKVLTHPSPDPDFSNGGPYAPVVQDGLVFVSDTISSGFAGVLSGREWLVDGRTGTALTTNQQWVVGGSGVLPEPSGPPTVAYIPIADNSGGVDRVIYLPGRPAGQGPFPTAGITSIWVGSKGETPPPGAIQLSPTTLVIQTRANRQGLPVFAPASGNSPLGIKLTIIKNNGDPLTPAEMAFYFKNTVSQVSGELTYQLNNPLPTVGNDGVTPDFGVRVDYTIDWGGVPPGLQPAIVRGSYNFPDDLSVGRTANLRRKILGNLAVSPQGTIYAVVSTGRWGRSNPSAGNDPIEDSGGSFYMVREEGRGSFRMLSRYDLFGPHSYALNQVPPVTYPATLPDNDDLTNMGGIATFLKGPFTRLTFTGGPTVRNGIVYVTATGLKNKPFPIPFTVLMAFNGEPDVPEIKVGALPNGFQIVQPDITQSPVKNNPTRFNVLQQGAQFTYEQEAGADYGTIRFPNLANVTRGLVSQSLSLSQPIILRVPGSPDQILVPEAKGGRWSPLLWFAVLHGMANSSSPMVTGNTLFVGGDSALPAFVTPPVSFPPPTTGILAGLNADISPTDPFMVPDPTRPWILQQEQLRILGGSPTDPNLDPNPNFRWPQIRGVQSFSVWRQRLLQTTLGTYPNSAVNVLGMASGDGTFVAWGNLSGGNGIYAAFNRADFIFADQGRIGRFDASGNPIWTSDSAVNAGNSMDVNSTTTVKGIVRPTRAYAVGDTDILVADPGSNRVMRLDASGRENRSISGLKVDPNFQPEGFQQNEPVTLNQPSDVTTFQTYIAAAQNPFTSPQPIEYWVRYVIADTGNERIIEVVDRYNVDPTTRRILDPVSINGKPQLNILYWHSPATFSGKGFAYTSLTRLLYNPSSPTGYYYVAGVGNRMPSRADFGLDTATGGTGQLRATGDGNGGIIIFDPSNPRNTQVINEVAVPAIGADAFWNASTGTFNSPAVASTTTRLGGVTSVTARNTSLSGSPTTTIMFTDSKGVYEIVPVGSTWTVDWMLPNEVYRVMRGTNAVFDTSGSAPFNGPGGPTANNAADLRATYARRLDSGDVLIVNGYSGTTRGGTPFSGEIVQINGLIDPNPVTAGNPNVAAGFSFSKVNFGFGTLSIQFELPPITGARGLVLPVFADRR